LWDTTEVYKVEVYARVRRAVQVDGMSIRQVAREFGLSRKTVRKMLQFSLPPGYERKKPVRRPKLGPWLGIIDQILMDDQSQPKKQRHTAKADLGPAESRARLLRRLHGGEGLRSPGALAAQRKHLFRWRIRGEMRKRTSGKRW
jgi:hypothetical protein